MKVRQTSVLMVLLVLVGLVALTSLPPAMAQPTTASPSETPEVKSPAPEGTLYKIGVCAAITGSSSSLGIPQRNTIAMLEKQLAEGIVGADGFHHGLKFTMYDTESNPDTAASVASRLIKEDEVDALICGTASGNAMAVVPLATENEVPMISMASARSLIQDPETGETRKWIFKVAPENQHSGEWQAVYLDKLGIKTVCDLYENSGYGQDCLNQSTKALKDKGIDVVYSDAFERSDTEFPQMTGVQASGCEVLVVGATPPGASMVTVAAREALPNVPVVQGHGVCNQDYIKLAGAAAENVVFPCGRLIIADKLPDTDPQKPVLVQYTATYTEYTNGEMISTFGGHAWDAAFMLVDAMSNLKEGLSLQERRAAIRDYLENSIVNWPGTGGMFNMSPTDHMGLTFEALTLIKVMNGAWEYYPEEEWKLE